LGAGPMPLRTVQLTPVFQLVVDGLPEPVAEKVWTIPELAEYLLLGTILGAPEFTVSEPPEY